MFTGAFLSMLLPGLPLRSNYGWQAFPAQTGSSFNGTFQGVAGIGEGFITVIYLAQ